MSSMSITESELRERIDDLSRRVREAHRWGRDEKHNMTYTIYTDGEVSYEGAAEGEGDGSDGGEGGDGVESYSINGATALGLRFAYEMKDIYGRPFTASCVSLEDAQRFVKEIRELVEIKTGQRPVFRPTLMETVEALGPVASEEDARKVIETIAAHNTAVLQGAVAEDGGQVAHA